MNRSSADLEANEPSGCTVSMRSLASFRSASTVATGSVGNEASSVVFSVAAEATSAAASPQARRPLRPVPQPLLQPPQPLPCAPGSCPSRPEALRPPVLQGWTHRKPHRSWPWPPRRPRPWTSVIQGMVFEGSCTLIKRRSRVLRIRMWQAALDKPRVHDGQLGFSIL